MGEVVEFPAGRIPQVTRRTAPSGPARPEELWRELVGDQLRRERQARGERLADVAERAGVSTQYLSEVERGLKDPSSEMLQAMTGALELTVRQLVTRFARSGVMCLAA
jgi:ribosome-binding protein aMBF1 (putative translation factor)